MQDIIIVCAGIYGQEVYSVITSINSCAVRQGKEKVYNLLGFIDDNPNALNGTGIDIPVVGTISDWFPSGNEVYAIGASDPKLKEKLGTMLKNRGCKFETLIAPWSIVSKNCEMGEGCFVTAYSISAGVKLGDFVNVNGSMLCPGTEIGDFSTTTGFTVVDNAKIGKSVFVGSHAVITPGVVVGDDAKVSVGSIVSEDVKAGATVFGIPAKEIN